MHRAQGGGELHVQPARYIDQMLAQCRARFVGGGSTSAQYIEVLCLLGYDQDGLCPSYCYCKTPHNTLSTQ